MRIGEYHLDLIPFDSDILSLELSSSFKDVSVDGDRTSLFYVAKALMKLQHLYGIIPNIQGKGANSLVWTLLRPLLTLLVHCRDAVQNAP